MLRLSIRVFILHIVVKKRYPILIYHIKDKYKKSTNNTESFKNIIHD
mgnify:CR=1 FL=1